MPFFECRIMSETVKHCFSKWLCFRVSVFCSDIIDAFGVGWRAVFWEVASGDIKIQTSVFSLKRAHLII